MIVKMWQPTMYHKGLKYSGRWLFVHTDMAERLVKVPEAIVYSHWRSLKEQQEMVQRGASKTLLSNHRRGVAVDLINWEEMQDKMRAVGLINDIPWDRNHYTIGGESRATLYPLLDSIGDVPTFNAPAKEKEKITKPKNMNTSIYLNSAEWEGGQYEGKDFVVRLHENANIIARLPRAQEFINSNFKDTWGVVKFQATYEKTIEWYARHKTVQDTKKAFNADYKDWESRNSVKKESNKSNPAIGKLLDQVVAIVKKIKSIV